MYWVPCCPPETETSLSLTVSEETQIKDVLKRYDTNGDGRLSKQELKLAFRGMGVRLPSWRAGRALRRADANNDGYITEQEMHALVQYANAKKWGFKIY
nr:probable calcium-binding protein CML15 [Ipomoea trifida]